MESLPPYNPGSAEPDDWPSMEKFEADVKRFERSAPPSARLSQCQQILIRDPVMTAPVPWSLAWCEDGELSRQDQFDLLQALVANEAVEVQHALIMAVERLSLADLCELSSGDVTGLCA